VNRLYVRKRDETEPRVLPGTEGAGEPVFSPNGKWIAFMADFAIKKVPLDGPVSMVVTVGDARGISWLNDDTLVYSPEPVSGVFKISANGDNPQPISKLDEANKERTHRWPQALPDGRSFMSPDANICSTPA
jgi:Tol biopolymer transport system component